MSAILEQALTPQQRAEADAADAAQRAALRAKAAAHYIPLAAEVAKAVQYLDARTPPRDAVETIIYVRKLEMAARFTVDEEYPEQVTLRAICLNGSWVLPELWLSQADIADACAQFAEMDE